jgi:hypothetical protein
MMYQRSAQNGPRAQKATRINHLSSALPAIHAAMQKTGNISVNPTSTTKLMKLRITVSLLRLARLELAAHAATVI